MTQLWPCPFCGAPAEYDIRRWRGGDRLGHTGHAVYCSAPDCNAENGLHETREDAFEAWNKRAAQSSWANEKAEMERQLAAYRDPDWTKNPRTARSDKNMEDGWALGEAKEAAEAALAEAVLILDSHCTVNTVELTRQADDEIKRLHEKDTEIAALRRRVARLERALRPFAQYAEGFGPHARDDSWVIATRPSGTRPLTMGHVREAHRALSPSPPAEERETP